MILVNTSNGSGNISLISCLYRNPQGDIISIPEMKSPLPKAGPFEEKIQTQIKWKENGEFK